MKGQYKGTSRASGKVKDPSLVLIVWYSPAGLRMGKAGVGQVVRATQLSYLYHEDTRKVHL